MLFLRVYLQLHVLSLLVFQKKKSILILCPLLHQLLLNNYNQYGVWSLHHLIFRCRHL